MEKNSVDQLKSILYHYDGSFEGFLSCVFEIYTKKDFSATISAQKQLCVAFLTQLLSVETNQQNFQRVATGIVKKIGRLGFLEVFKAFASCNENKESVIFEYLKLVFSHGRKVTEMLSNTAVIAFNEMLNRVNFEIHRFRGFVRFRQTTSGAFVAPIRPDNDILEFLMPEFVERFGVQQFAIVDVGRNEVGIFDGKKWEVGEFSAIAHFQLTDEEKLFQQLWKNYYETVTIKQRESQKRRLQFMPKRYWEFLTEIQNDK